MCFDKEFICLTCVCTSNKAFPYAVTHMVQLVRTYMPVVKIAHDVYRANAGSPYREEKALLAIKFNFVRAKFVIAFVPGAFCK